MKLHLASLLTVVFLAACASTPVAVTPDAGPTPAPPPPPVATTTTPAPAVTAVAEGSITGATFEAAIAAAHLTPVTLPDLKREMTHDMSAPASPVEGRKITLLIQGGFNGESLEFAKDASGHLVRLVRQPDVTVKEVVFQGCEESHFAGGRAWFDRVTFELPAGTTWGGTRIVKYPVVKETIRYTGKKANGEECPPPRMMMD